MPPKHFELDGHSADLNSRADAGAATEQSVPRSGGFHEGFEISVTTGPFGGIGHGNLLEGL